MRLPNAVPDAPVYKATLREMESLPELLAAASELAVKHGAVRIDPPPEWTPPPLRMARSSRFFVREQTLPTAPLVDLSDTGKAEAPVEQTKRRRRRVVEGSEDDWEAGGEAGKEEDKIAVGCKEKVDDGPNDHANAIMHNSASEQPNIAANVGGAPVSSVRPSDGEIAGKNAENAPSLGKETHAGVSSLDGPRAPAQSYPSIVPFLHGSSMPQTVSNGNCQEKQDTESLGRSPLLATVERNCETLHASKPSQTSVDNQNESRSELHLQGSLLQTKQLEGPTGADALNAIALPHAVEAVPHTVTGAEQKSPVESADLVPQDRVEGQIQSQPHCNPVIVNPCSRIVGSCQRGLPENEGNDGNGRDVESSQHLSHPHQSDPQLPLSTHGATPGQASSSVQISLPHSSPQIRRFGPNSEEIVGVGGPMKSTRSVPGSHSINPQAADTACAPLVRLRSELPPLSVQRPIYDFSRPRQLSQPAQQSVINDLATFAYELKPPTVNNCQMRTDQRVVEGHNELQMPRAGSADLRLQVHGHPKVPSSGLAHSVGQDNETFNTSVAGSGASGPLPLSTGRGSIGSLLNPSGPMESIALSPGISADTGGTPGPSRVQTIPQNNVPIVQNDSDSRCHAMGQYATAGALDNTRVHTLDRGGVVLDGHLVRQKGADIVLVPFAENCRGDLPTKSMNASSAPSKTTSNNAALPVKGLVEQLAAATQESSKEQLKASGNIDLLLPDEASEYVKAVGKARCTMTVENNDLKSVKQDEGELHGRTGTNATVRLPHSMPVSCADERLVVGDGILQSKAAHGESESVKKVHEPQVEKESSRVIQLDAGEKPSIEGRLPRTREPASHAHDATGSSTTGRSRHPSKQPAKRQRRGPNKRKVNHISLMNWDQDEDGRLTVPIAFPDSPNPLSLSGYEKKSLTLQENLRQVLLEDKSLELEELERVRKQGGKDWLRNVDVLEKIFWTSLRRGVSGKPFTVAYGVDVEAEGAFDSVGQSYVEWYGVDSTGRMTKKKMTKSRSGTKYAKEEPALVETGNRDRDKDTPAPDFSKVQDAKDQDNRPSTDQLKGSGEVETDVVVEEGHGFGPPFEPPFHPSRFDPPTHVGNLNRSGLLRHMPRMPGINHSMYYVGQLFTRFCWHVEDAFLNSVSYLHHGSAEKVWYAIPPEHAPAFEAYASEHMFSEDLVDEHGSGQALLMNKTTISDPRELPSRGIPVFRIVHKPGSFVLTAPRGYHTGFNCGFNVAEAVNFALPPWFPVGREASRFAREIRKPLCVPWEYLLFHEAKAMRDDAQVKRRRKMRSVHISSNAGILAKELASVVSSGEQRIREFAARKNCRIAMLSEIDALVKNNQLGPEFGHGAGMVCSLCGHACHFYAEICASCDGSLEARCEQHFGEGHKLCHVPGHKSILVRRHDPVLLADVLTTLEDIAGITRSKEELLIRYTGYLRPWDTPMESSGLRLRMNLKLAASRVAPNLTNNKGGRDGARRQKKRKQKKEPEISRKRDLDSEEEGPRKRRRRKPVSKSGVSLRGTVLKVEPTFDAGPASSFAAVLNTVQSSLRTPIGDDCVDIPSKSKSSGH